MAVFVGCSDADDDDDDDNGHGDEINGGEHIHGIDFDAAMAAFPVDTVMISAGDLTLTWPELYLFLFSTVYQLSYGFSIEVDWDEEFIVDTLLSDMVLDYSVEEALPMLIFEYAVNLLGLSLDQEVLDTIETEIGIMIADAGSEEAFENDLRERGYINLDVFRSISAKGFYQGLLLTSLYGEDLLNLSDASVAAFAEENDFLRAKHILLSFLREEDGYSLQEIDENKVELRAQAEGLLNLLNEHYGDDDFLDFFDALMIEHSQDPGSFAFPDGYLFQPYEMVPSFSEACANLNPGEFSGIVVTDYGYHIILRLPIDYDAIPYSMAHTGYTLRQFAVMNDFYEVKIPQWRESMNLVFAPEYYTIDLPKIFAWCDH